MPITFVVSTGRAGSTLLSRILALHPDLLSISEFLSVLQGILRRNEFPDQPMDGARLWQLVTAPDPLADAMIRHGQAVPEMFYPYGTGRFRAETGIPNICHSTLSLLSDDPDGLFDALAARVPSWGVRPAGEQYLALFDELCAMLGRRVVVERSGGSIIMARTLRRHFPDARFVLMYRDGPDTALSMSRFPMFKLGMLVVRAIEEAGLPEAASLAELQAAMPAAYEGVLSPPYDFSGVPAIQMSPVPFGERWSAMIEYGTSVLATWPPQVQSTLCYEELLTDPAVELTKLAAFLGVPPRQDWIDAASKLIIPDRIGTAAELDDELMAALRDACAPGKAALAAFLLGR